MTKRDKLTGEAVRAFFAAQPGWKYGEGSVPSITRTFEFKEYADGIAFVVRLAFAAEKRDHHPDIHVLRGRVRVDWSTHDAGGVTAVDIEMAEVADRIYRDR